MHKHLRDICLGPSSPCIRMYQVKRTKYTVIVRDWKGNSIEMMVFIRHITFYNSFNKIFFHYLSGILFFFLLVFSFNQWKFYQDFFFLCGLRSLYMLFYISAPVPPPTHRQPLLCILVLLFHTVVYR